jgi:hypothetical protein
MKNSSFPTLLWWKSRSPKRSIAAKRLAEGYGMSELIPACHLGSVSAFEQMKIKARLRELFSGSTDRWFMAPICAACHRRFADMNEMDISREPDFELL